MAAWVLPAIQAGASILGGLMGSGGSPNQYGGGMDYFNKVARKPMESTLGLAKQVYDQGATTPLMDQASGMMTNLPNTISPYLQYGNQMLQASPEAFNGVMGAGNALARFDPTGYNQQFQAGQAVGPAYGQQAYSQVMQNAQGAINPMLDQIGKMNSRIFGEQMLPRNAGAAIMAGDTSGSKWTQSNSLDARSMAEANAQAASSLYGNAFNQAAGVGADYGSAAAQAQNAMTGINTQMGNQLRFQQGQQNASGLLDAWRGAGSNFGQALNMSDPYFASMMQSQIALPQMLFNMGLQQRNAPADWLTQYQNAIGTVGTAGAPTGGTGGVANNQGQNFGAAMGATNEMLGSLFDAFKTTKKTT
jgi:hypothetical protein